MHFCLLLFAAGAVTLFFLLWWRARTAEKQRNDVFGITLPQGYAVHGIDVSRYQGRINWKEVSSLKAGGLKLEFVFIKATEGLKDVDPEFQRNWEEAKVAGMVRGAYHFFIATKSGKKQAAHFISQVRLAPGDLPPVLDVEETYGVSRQTLLRHVKEWLQAVEAHYGVRPVVYTGAKFYENYFSGHLEEYPLWVAHYLQPYAPRVKRKWHFWQHCESGRVKGIRHKVDFNVFNGDTLAFRRFLVPEDKQLMAAER